MNGCGVLYELTLTKLMKDARPIKVWFVTGGIKGESSQIGVIVDWWIEANILHIKVQTKDGPFVIRDYHEMQGAHIHVKEDTPEQFFKTFKLGGDISFVTRSGDMFSGRFVGFERGNGSVIDVSKESLELRNDYLVVVSRTGGKSKVFLEGVMLNTVSFKGSN